MFQHVKGVPSSEAEETQLLPPKLDRIKAIHGAGLEVIHIIHRHGMTQEIARVVEGALIDAYPGLTNIQGGYGSGDFGPRSPREIIRDYGLPEFPYPPKHKLILININAVDAPHDVERVRQQVRGSWRLSVERAKQADYVVAVVRGVAVGVFRASNWTPVAQDKAQDKPRYNFEATNVEPHIWDTYVGSQGKRIAANELRHVQNPIRYVNI